MAEAWNTFAAKREKASQNDVIKYYREHPYMLESYFESGRKNNNTCATLQPHLKNIENLSKEHRLAGAAPMPHDSTKCPWPISFSWSECNFSRK
jgi:hypothetical protein